MKPERWIAGLALAALVACVSCGVVLRTTRMGRALLTVFFDSTSKPGIAALEARGCRSVFASDTRSLRDDGRGKIYVTCLPSEALSDGCRSLAGAWLAATHDPAPLELNVWEVDGGRRCEGAWSADGGWAGIHGP